jgi:hypothetical protein
MGEELREGVGELHAEETVFQERTQKYQMPLMG